MSRMRERHREIEKYMSGAVIIILERVCIELEIKGRVTRMCMRRMTVIMIFKHGLVLL